MNAKTRGNLLKAMHSEAFAYAQYILYARRARAGGQHEVAELFELAADREFLDRFAELAELAELVGSDEQNLHDALDGSGYAPRRSYRGFARQAENVGENGVAERLIDMRSAARKYIGAFRLALAKVERDRQKRAVRPAWEMVGA